jgi:hypothetical protein
MGEAFDAACAGLQDGGQPDLVREIIAKRIIEAAKKGERDPVRLRNAGLGRVLINALAMSGFGGTADIANSSHVVGL